MLKYEMAIPCEMKSVLHTIHAFHITTKVVSSNSVHGQGVLDTTLCDKVCQ